MIVWLLYTLTWSPILATPVPHVTMQVYRTEQACQQAMQAATHMQRRLCVRGAGV